MSAPGRRRDERGTATAFVVGMSVTLLACAGLVVDGGTAINARMKLADEVEQAARAGAQQIDVDTLRATGTLQLDRGAAEQAARTFIGGRGYSGGAVAVDADTVTVTADEVVETTLLTLIGIRTFEVSATATAEAATQ
ncbi:pilus assembly protein TadG-related protein [Nocardioides perillae]|uniref:Flp pilus assembly protein TadG n=1 Tax=Nocardioides perillae TaxID=1119534 RepID=A0A7Y9RRB0_9ACTN|nr:Flp pilus assembly protein TadG [Nocardioides perillae]